MSQPVLNIEKELHRLTPSNLLQFNKVVFNYWVEDGQSLAPND